MYLFFVHSYIAAKIEKKEKIEEKVTMRFKMNFSNHRLILRLNLSLNNTRNCEEITTFLKVFKKIVNCKKKGILNLAYKQELLFKKSKKPHLKKCTRKIEEVELLKVLEKYPKLKVVMNVNSFNDVEIC